MRYFVLLLLLALFGCGGSSPDSTTSVLTTPTTTVVGRATLDEPLTNARLQFLGPEGQPLEWSGDTSTDVSGHFQIELPNEVTTFRAIAARDGEAYAADVENYDGSLVVISPLTNLAAQLHSTGVPLDQAEAQVRRFLGLEPEADLRFSMVHLAHRPGFQAQRFLSLARAAGNQSENGASPYVLSLVSQIQAGQMGSGLFTDTPLWAEEGARLGLAVVAGPTGGLSPGPLTGWALTAISSLTYETTQPDSYAQLAELIEQIEREVLELEAILLRELAAAEFSELESSDTQVLAIITTLTEVLHDQLQGTGATPAQLQSLARDFNSDTMLGILTTLQTIQFGGPGGDGLLATAQKLVGIVPDGEIPASNLYSNKGQYNPLASEFNFIAANATRAINLVVEGAHGLEPPGLALARTQYDQYQALIALCATAVPMPLPNDQLILDRKHGKLWLDKPMGARHYHDALAFAKAYGKGTSLQWRIAESSDLKALLESGKEQREVAGLSFSSIPLVDGKQLVGLGDGDQGNLLDGGSESDGGWYEKRPFLLLAEVPEDVNESLSMARLTSLEVRPMPGVPNQLQALGTFRLPNGHEFKEVDVTGRVQWSADSPDILRIGNPPASDSVDRDGFTTVDFKLGPGSLNWLQNGTTRVKATALDPFGGPPLTHSIPLSRNDLPAPTPTGLRLGPKNLVLTTAPFGQTLSFTRFLSNGTSDADLTGVQFTTSIPAFATVDSTGGLQLNLTGNPNVPSFTVTARLGSLTDVSTFYILIP